MSSAQRPRVAFLGPAGTHTHEALSASAVEAVDEVSCADVREAMRLVSDGAADCCVIPIENSLEGSVTATLDLLADGAGELEIVAEVIQPIHHCLLARPGTHVENVRAVLSHPQALAQCDAFLRREVPLAELRPVASTAEAARIVGDSIEQWAAVGSKRAAEAYGVAVLVEDIEDSDGNLTRFVWLARPRGEPGPWPRGEATKTSIVFWGFNDESPGALVAVLGELADRDINLSKIESRPRRVRLGHYMFFADLDGPAGADHVAAALDGLRARVESLVVLGSYVVA